MTEGKRDIGDALKDLNKMYGDSIQVWRANDDMVVKEEEGIPTGSFVLDEAISRYIWGIPKGRIIQFAGPQSSGKTLLSLSCIAQMQKMYPDMWACFIDAEFTFKADWAIKLGVDVNRVVVVKENTGRLISEFLTGIPNSKDPKKPKSKPGLLDMEQAEPTGLGLIVLDSIATLQPPIEETAEAGKQNIAPLSRFLPAELRKITPMLARTGASLIGINQIRVDPGVMYGNPETSPGGNAFKHSQSLCVNFSKIGGKDNLILNDVGDVIGHKIRAKIAKNKIAPGEKTVEFDILYEKGVANHHLEAVTLGLKYGLIERPTQQSYVYEDEKYTGRSNIEKFFGENPDQVDVVIEKAKEIAKEI